MPVRAAPRPAPKPPSRTGSPSTICAGRRSPCTTPRACAASRPPPPRRPSAPRPQGRAGPRARRARRGARRRRGSRGGCRCVGSSTPQETAPGPDLFPGMSRALPGSTWGCASSSPPPGPPVTSARSIPFAHACRRAGHDVLVVAPARSPPTPTAPACPTRPVADPRDDVLAPVVGARATSTADTANQIALSEMFAGEHARRALPGMLTTMRRWRPDVVVRETARVLLDRRGGGARHPARPRRDLPRHGAARSTGARSPSR